MFLMNDGGHIMAVSYNRLWKLLVDRKRSKADLRRQAAIALNTIIKDVKVPFKMSGGE